MDVLNYQTYRVHDISPTFLSSDVLTPSDPGRITIPWNGKQTIYFRKYEPHKWGESITAYGGIGALPFQGKVRLRDLFVTRGHDHFSGSVNKYIARVQPYGRSRLSRSSSRQNDQVLPPVFGIDNLLQMTRTMEQNQFTLPVDHYFSHRSKFAVFPTIDHERKKEDGSYVLSENTRNALSNDYEKLYKESVYSHDYSDPTRGQGIRKLALSEDVKNHILDKMKIFDIYGLKSLFLQLKKLKHFHIAEHGRHQEYIFDTAISICDSNMSREQKVFQIKSLLQISDGNNVSPLLDKPDEHNTVLLNYANDEDARENYKYYNDTEEPEALAAYLQPTGGRVVDRLGLGFKRLAQLRFHARYRDKVPDPRENHRTLRKNIFHGIHAARLR